MNSRTKGYDLASLQGVVSHYKNAVTAVCDGVDQEWWGQERRLLISSLVRSGDYFATLATQLDSLSQGAEKHDEALAYDLQLMVADLLYLQRNYEIHKKD